VDTGKQDRHIKGSERGKSGGGESIGEEVLGKIEGGGRGTSLGESIKKRGGESKNEKGGKKGTSQTKREG